MEFVEERAGNKSRIIIAIEAVMNVCWIGFYTREISSYYVEMTVAIIERKT